MLVADGHLACVREPQSGLSPIADSLPVQVTATPSTTNGSPSAWTRGVQILGLRVLTSFPSLQPWQFPPQGLEMSSHRSFLNNLV